MMEDETMTRVSAIGPDVVPASQSTLTEYEGVVLDTEDPDKLVPFVDNCSTSG